MAAVVPSRASRGIRCPSELRTYQISSLHTVGPVRTTDFISALSRLRGGLFRHICSRVVLPWKPAVEGAFGHWLVMFEYMYCTVLYMEDSFDTTVLENNQSSKMNFNTGRSRGKTSDFKEGTTFVSLERTVSKFDRMSKGALIWTHEVVEQPLTCSGQLACSFLASRS